MTTRARVGVREVSRAYFELTKPGIIRMILITTYCSMLVAERGFPDWGITLWTMLGMGLITGSANAMNMIFDQDIDAVMTRTSHRPLPEGRVDTKGALLFSLGLGISGFLLLNVMVNPMTALAALGGHLFYVLIYTMWLKRSTPQNIVIGGAAGAVPPLVGWAAVTGDLSVAAWIMFAVIFFWTPPHFWALALYKRQDYGRAQVPMLPVVRGEKHTKHQMLYYAVLLLVVTSLLALVHMGALYLVASVALGLGFIYFVWKTHQEKEGYKWAKRTFAFSLLYLAVLFVAMSADAMLMEPLHNLLFEAAPQPIELQLTPLENANL